MLQSGPGSRPRLRLAPAIGGASLAARSTHAQPVTRGEARTVGEAGRGGGGGGGGGGGDHGQQFVAAAAADRVVVPAL